MHHFSVSLQQFPNMFDHLKPNKDYFLFSFPITSSRIEQHSNTTLTMHKYRTAKQTMIGFPNFCCFQFEFTVPLRSNANANKGH